MKWLGATSAKAFLLIRLADPFGLRCCCSCNRSSRRILLNNQEARPIMYHQNIELQSAATAEYPTAIGVHRVSVGQRIVLREGLTIENNVSQPLEVVFDGQTFAENNPLSDT